MKSKEKILENLEDLDKISDEQLHILTRLALDKDMLIRCKVAELLINAEGKEYRDILIKLVKDKENLVRTEAYDTLCAYPCKKVEKILESAMKEENDEIACSYAIMSWGDVVNELYDDITDKISIIDEIRKRELIKKSEQCRLSCEYVCYFFGIDDSFERIVSFITSDDYHIRCSVINMFLDIIDDANEQEIRRVLDEVIVKEKTKAVKSCAEKVLREIISK